MIKGMLPIGIEYNGETHRHFEVRPRKVRDSIDAAADPEVAADEALIGIAILSRQIVSLGSIPPEAITWELLYEAWEDDVKAINEKAEEAAKSLRNFRNEGERAPEAFAGVDEAGVHGEGSRGDDGRGSDGVASGLQRGHDHGKRLPGENLQS